MTTLQATNQTVKPTDHPDVRKLVTRRAAYQTAGYMGIHLMEWVGGRCYGPRFLVSRSAWDESVEFTEHDTLDEALAAFDAIVSPDPVPAPAVFEPTPEDRAWWARESESLAPVSGGSPEEHAAAWSMPGEVQYGDEMDPEEFDRWLDSIYEDAPDLSDDASGAFGGHDS